MEKGECVWFPVCPMRRAWEAGRLEQRFIDAYCRGDFEQCVRFQMEERGEPHPDWMRQDGVMDERLKGA